MAFLKREHAELLIGIGVLALGLGLLLFTFSHALAIATAPGDFFRGQFPQQTPQGPSASFTWDTNGSNTTTVQDTSRQGDVAITSWDWNFGDGTRAVGRNPGPHTYANASVYQVSLTIRDGNGKESRAVHGHATAAPRPLRSAPSIRPGRLVLDGPPGASIRDDIGDGDGFAHSLYERRTDPGHDYEDAQNPVVLAVHSDPEDDVRVRVHRGGQALHDFVSGAEPETRAGANVDEGAVRPAIVDLEERIVEGVSNEPVRVVFRVLSVEDRGRAAPMADRAQVAEVQVDQRRHRDRLGDALDHFADQMVHDREGLFDRKIRDEVQQSVVVEENQRIRAVPESLDARPRIHHPATFRPERRGRQADHDAPRSLGKFRHMGRDSRPRASTQSDRDEREICVPNLVPEFLLRDLGAPFADLWPTSCPHPARHAPSDQELAVRLNRIEMDRVRVHDDRSGAVDPHAMETVNGVPARATASDHEDLRAGRAERVEERLVPGALRSLEAHP